MNKSKLCTALGLSGTLFISGAAMAAGQEQHSMNFQALDQNRDGSLTYSEVQNEEVIQENWDTIDSDQDGIIDRVEFSAFEAEQSMETGESQENQESQENRVSPERNPRGGDMQSPDQGDEPGYDAR